MTFARSALLALFCGAAVLSTAQASLADAPPPIPREFRGVWVASVQNIDWPTRKGLTTDEQKRELIKIFDKCVDLNLNAVILQIRPSADALYPSKLEPWSEYLSGKMGQPPKPFYDPLKFAVDEAHKRGLQLHVWFNPYRVRLPGARGKATKDHASKAHPEIVRKYGEYLWFDPGEPEAIDHFIAVLNDVVKRYDIDGVHIDDYFYPYQIRDDAGELVPFPDEESYKRAVAKGEKLERDDWRRQNVNQLVERMYDEVKKAKPWVLVGISPFGIWRPGHPEGITGLDQYSALYADVRKWQHEGWLDYLTPQLYWSVDSKGQSYPKLLAWWHEQNLKKRHLWPGNFTSKIGRDPRAESSESVWTADELLRQIEATRAQEGATGNIHFSMKALTGNYDGIADKLKAGPYAKPALVPESPWLGREAPPRPDVAAKQKGNAVDVDMKLAARAASNRRSRAKASANNAPWLWIVRVETDGDWQTAIVPGHEMEHQLTLPDGQTAKRVVVSGVSRLGREGRTAQANVKKGD